MRKIIHSSFELDLSSFNITDTETNNQFSDSFFTKITFPFEIDLIEDLDKAFGFISIFNSGDIQTYFEVKYIHDDTIEEAIFEIEQIQQKVSCTLSYGFDQLPSWDKKLSELSLEKFVLPTGTTIYNFANTIVSQTWPAVNYNFPQVHTDIYDILEYPWASFKQIINYRPSNQFSMNSVSNNGIETTRNIIQPLPYWLHILQRGMIDSGYTLSGNILNDEKLKKACLFSNVDYYQYNEPTSEVIEADYNLPTSTDTVNLFGSWYFENPNIAVSYWITNPTINYKRYSKSYTFLKKGKYRINGSFYGRRHKLFDTSFVIFGNSIIHYNKTYIAPAPGGTIFYSIYEEVTENFDVTFDIFDISYPIFINFSNVVNGDDVSPFELSIESIYYYGSNNEIVTVIENENKVDLTKAVPDITFGDFIKVVKNWFNYDLKVVGKFAVMNKVEDLMNYESAIDLSDFEIKYPLRKFKQGFSYLLKFQDIENANYPFLPVFQSRNGHITSGYITDTKTETIEVLALPLPTLTRNNSTTAYALEDNDAKVYLVKYDGLINGKNIAGTNQDYLIPAIHLTNWKKWFQFRINSQGFTISFKSFAEKIKDLNSKSKIYAYNKIHLIKTINKTEVRPDLFEVEIETESLE